MIHWLLVALVVYACTLVLVAIVCTPYLRRRNLHRAYMQRWRRCQRCGHVIEGYTFDELDYQEQLHLQMAHAPPVAQQLVEAA
jgi:hypothetical protein